MSRIKFALARGARLQAKGLTTEHWVAFDPRGGVWGHGTYRVHPDDKPLLYGPISSAMRDLILFRDDVAYGKTIPEWAYNAAESIQQDIWHECQKALDTPTHLYTESGETKGMFYLLVAEYLADEGL